MSQLLENTLNDIDVKAGKEAALNIMHHSDQGNMFAVAEGICVALNNAHRTKQQDFWRAIDMVAQEYAKIGCDLRNEASVEYCKAIKNLRISLPRL